MRAALTIVAATAFAGLGVSVHAEYPNKLLGGWTLVKGECAQRHFQFVDGAEIVDENYPGFGPTRTTYRIDYNNADPQIAYVSGHGGHIGFQFLSADRVRMMDSNECEYARG